MKKTFASLLFPAAILLLSACHSGDAPPILQDSASVSAGATLFEQHCSSCHNFRQNGIGPNLSGVTAKTSADWVRRFIRHPQELIRAGDERARALYQEYGTVMPSFAALSGQETEQLLAYLHTHKEVVRKPLADGSLEDPLPGKIPMSPLAAELQPVAEFPSTSGKKPRTRLAKLEPEPGTGTLFVHDQRGVLYALRNSRPEVFLEIARWKPKFIHEPGLATGLGSFAFHPDYVQNGLFYTTHTEAPGAARADFPLPDTVKKTLQWVLCEWKRTGKEGPLFAGTVRELFRTEMVAGIHGVQEIAFNPEARKGSPDYGLLYIGVGDGGCVENGYPWLAHDRGRIWGTVLRIDPKGRNSRNGRYGIPGDNPFAHQKDALGEIYAMGFRNPSRLSWTAAGDLLVAHIGQRQIESVNVVRKGDDYGWPHREGSFLMNPLKEMDKVYPVPLSQQPASFARPAAQYDHDEGKAIAGGFEYRGRAVPAFRGLYLFGDIPTGRLFCVRTADLRPGAMAPIREWTLRLNGRPVSLKDLTGNGRVDLRFGRDAQGELYLFTKAEGKLYRLAEAGRSTAF
ncbi:MAG TPA: PQQ-dependent sugar dehydrogenase [Chitinophagaceae bacterium]|jgi:mono/diheme cytochrome c family protein/ribosomal protein L24E|nr:PQQ-dependent sugar dehydrogenase [Chitinophagaceae bacterium]